jgi:hypothetical protein
MCGAMLSSNSRSVTTLKTLAKSVFSIATSKVTSGGSEEEMEEENNSHYNADPATKPGVAFGGMQMQMLTRARKQQSNNSMNEDNASGDNDGADEQERNHKEAVQLTKNMNAAMARRILSSLEEYQNNNNKEEFDSVIDSENTINFYSDDKGGKDFLKDDLDDQLEDLTLVNDFDTASEVSSVVFDATHFNKFEEPDNFKKLLWDFA